MKNVLDLTDKDTGDVAGDTSFVISRKNDAYECKMHPDSFMCVAVAQFSGDDKNSTDLVLEMQVEVDGQWGPYLKCNPDNVTDPSGGWNCAYDIKQPNPPNFPKQCDPLTNYDNICLRGTPVKVLNKTDLGDCCAAASKANQKFVFEKKTNDCMLFSGDTEHYYHCQDTVYGHRYEPP